MTTATTYDEWKQNYLHQFIRSRRYFDFMVKMRGGFFDDDGDAGAADPLSEQGKKLLEARSKVRKEIFKSVFTDDDYYRADAEWELVQDHTYSLDKGELAPRDLSARMIRAINNCLNFGFNNIGQKEMFFDGPMSLETLHRRQREWDHLVEVGNDRIAEWGPIQ